MVGLGRGILVESNGIPAISQAVPKQGEGQFLTRDLSLYRRSQLYC